MMGVSLHIMTAMAGRRARARRCAAGLAAVLAVAGAAQAAPTLPEIRLSSQNSVPQCVTPDRLMAFLKQRNGALDPRFRNIASYYREHGEAWRVRWDYAFFQMAIETNFLTYRAPSGRMGDVNPRQNNFAGIGTTGGGVPGDSFPDVSTGVLGQIQHLVVYSGESIPQPVAPRTRLKQDDILAMSHELKRAVRFSDLAGRWAADRKYGGSIEWVAQRFRAEYCAGRATPAAEVLPWQDSGVQPPTAKGTPPVKAVSSWEQEASDPKPRKAKASKPAKVTAPKPVRAVPAPHPVPVAPMARAPAADAPFRLFAPPAGLAEARINSAPPVASRADEASGPSDTAPAAVSGKTVAGFMIGGVDKPDYPPPSGLGVKPSRCVVETARYGGETTVLVKAPEGPDVHYVALSVLDGFEASMTQTFLDSRPEGGEVVGTFVSRDHAMARARALCPD